MEGLVEIALADLDRLRDRLELLETERKEEGQKEVRITVTNMHKYSNPIWDKYTPSGHAVIQTLYTNLDVVIDNLRVEIAQEVETKEEELRYLRPRYTLNEKKVTQLSQELKDANKTIETLKKRGFFSRLFNSKS